MNNLSDQSVQHSDVTHYQCPLCATMLSLQPASKQFACQNRHHFDLAKEGYLNLLPVQHKSSLTPGDHKHMLQARRAFLEAGYYAPMAEALVLMLRSHASSQAMRLLDLGCGEGYYSRAIANAFASSASIQQHGLDIAKFAVAAAAKKQPDARFVVASVNRLPYEADYFDTILRVFAPSNALELKRVLKMNGLLLIVTPGPRHLWQLKAFIYPEVREHAEESLLMDDLVCIATDRLQYVIQPTPEHRMALLQMTPFAWHANAAVQAAIKAEPHLDIEVDFSLALYQKRLP